MALVLPGGQDDRAALREEFKKRQSELAEDDVGAHFALAVWCEEVGLKGEANLVLRKVIAHDPNHPEARAKLGFVLRDGKWQLERSRGAEKEKKPDPGEGEGKEAGEKPADPGPGGEGKVRFKDAWVPAADLPFLEIGLVRRGEIWVTEDEAKKLDGGWKFLEGELWSPDDAAQVEKGLLPADGLWIPKAEANEFHSSWEKAWEIPTAHLRLRTNVDRDRAAGLAARAEDTYRRLRRLFGAAPPDGPLLVYAFRTDAEYLKYQDTYGEEHGIAYGGFLALQDEQRPGVAAAERPEWAPYHVAHAVAHDFVHRLVGEKRARDVPAWLEEGIAGWAEKCYDEHHRKWSVEEIGRRGGLGDPKIVAKGFGLSAQDPEGSQKQILEVGLLVAYFADPGTPPPVRRVFEAALQGIARGQKQEMKKASEALLKDPDLEKNLRAFAGLQ